MEAGATPPKQGYEAQEKALRLPIAPNRETRIY